MIKATLVIEQCTAVVEELEAYLTTVKSGLPAGTQLYIVFKEVENVVTPITLDDYRDADLHTKLNLQWDAVDSLSGNKKLALRKAGIVYVGDAVMKTEAKMMKTKNIGSQTYLSVRYALQDLGLEFEMDMQGWMPPPRA